MSLLIWDDSIVRFTSAISNGVCSIESGSIEFTLPDVTLRQEPSEVIGLGVSCTPTKSMIDTAAATYNFDVVLVFNNDVHKYTKNYDYEIVCKELGPNNKQRLLLSSVQTRSERSMHFTTEVVFNKKSGLIKLCISIRRLHRINIDVVETFAHDDFSALLKTGVYSDVSMVVGDKVFKAHKHVLSLKSEVFRVMFQHEMSEKQDGVVNIDDFETEVIEEMLSYIYTGRVTDLNRLSIELFKVAHMYQIPGLQSKCEESFLFIFNCQNVVPILELASLYEVPDLKDRAMLFIQKHRSQMVKVQSFLYFLCRDLKVDTVVNTLKLYVSYRSAGNGLEKVKIEAFKFIKEHSGQMTLDQEFLRLFRINPSLMSELFVYMHS